MNPTIIDVHSHLASGPKQISMMMDSARKNLLKQVFVSSLSTGTGCKEFPTKEDISQANEHTFKYCERYSDILKGYVYLNPCENWENELTKWADHTAFVGIKLWISLKNSAGSSRVCIPILKAAAELTVPVLIHSFYRSGANYRGELAPDEVVSLARLSPETNIIMAHLGGNFEKGCQTVQKTKNIFVDISGFFCIPREH